jgi:hypothetical protein
MYKLANHKPSGSPPLLAQRAARRRVPLAVARSPSGALIYVVRRVLRRLRALCRDRRHAADARRHFALRRAGYRVLRFTAEEVERQLPLVLDRIQTEVERLRGEP